MFLLIILTMQLTKFAIFKRKSMSIVMMMLLVMFLLKPTGVLALNNQSKIKSNSIQKCDHIRSNESAQGISSYLVCHNFNAWSDLNSELKSIINKSAPDLFFLKPNQPIQLTSELNMTRFFEITDSGNPGSLYVYGLSGVTLYPWPSFSKCDNNPGPRSLFLFLSTIEFYVINTPSGGCTCNRDLLPDNSNTQVSLLSSSCISKIHIDFGNTYGSTFCPYLFNLYATNGG
jgi:hypothetical protein